MLCHLIRINYFQFFISRFFFLHKHIKSTFIWYQCKTMSLLHFLWVKKYFIVRIKFVTKYTFHEKKDTHRFYRNNILSKKKETNSHELRKKRDRNCKRIHHIKEIPTHFTWYHELPSSGNLIFFVYLLHGNYIRVKTNGFTTSIQNSFLFSLKKFHIFHTFCMILWDLNCSARLDGNIRRKKRNGFQSNMRIFIFKNGT